MRKAIIYLEQPEELQLGVHRISASRISGPDIRPFSISSIRPDTGYCFAGYPARPDTGYPARPDTGYPVHWFLALKKPAFIGIYWLFYGNNLFLASCRMLYYVWVVLKT